VSSLNIDRCVVRNTGARKGRSEAVTPGTTAARHLHYGRIILDPSDHLSFGTGERETGLVCLTGHATVTTEGATHSLVPFDALYVPRDATIAIASGAAGVDLAEISAAVSARHPVQFVAFADVQKDAGLHFKAGSDASRRELNILIGKNVQAGRIMAGVTFSAPGNWTSWPPHEHAAMLEEAYLYVAMPEPAFGIQLVYTDARTPELAVVVRENDCVLMPEGYHPNVAAPGGPINFLWMMAANREDVDRQFGVVNVQPEFAAGGSGIEKGRAQK
jgi:5-deoxy-glucuronate isomerase